MVEDAATRAVERSLAAIAGSNEHLRAVTHLDADRALARAQAHDRAAKSGPLTGLTFVAKDLIDVAGLPTSGGSRLFGQAPASIDAVCVQDLEAAGATVIGKSNMHELAVGGARNPWFGQVINPLSTGFGTGGTSSGSAAAVAAGLCDFALGTDSGGSNRSPAAATGLFGFKPTNGLLSMEGVRHIAPSLDTVGLLARDIQILKRAFTALSGQAESSAPVELEAATIGRTLGLFGAIDPAVEQVYEAAFEAVRAAGGTVVEIAIADAAALTAAGKDILRYEFVREYGRLIEEHGDRVGAHVRAFVQSASGLTGARYDEARALIEAHRRDWLPHLDQLDAILVPTAPGLAPRLQDECTRVGANWLPYGAAGGDFRMWANSIGLPAVAIPVALAGPLPASIQLASRPGADGFLIDLSAALGREIIKMRAAPSRTREL